MRASAAGGGDLFLRATVRLCVIAQVVNTNLKKNKNNIYSFNFVYSKFHLLITIANGVIFYSPSRIKNGGNKNTFYYHTKSKKKTTIFDGKFKFGLIICKVNKT